MSSALDQIVHCENGLLVAKLCVLTPLTRPVSHLEDMPIDCQPFHVGLLQVVARTGAMGNEWLGR